MIIKVGEKLKISKDIDRFKNRAGGLMEIHPEGHLIIILFLPDITDSEINIINKNKIKFKILEKENMILTYLSFVGSNLIFELPFEPSKYDDDRLEKFEVKKTVELYSAESKEMITQNIRVFSLPFKMQDKIKESWKKDYSNYDEFVDEVSRESVINNYKKAKYIGKV